jgi:hypothetical protein
VRRNWRNHSSDPDNRIRLSVRAFQQLARNCRAKSERDVRAVEVQLVQARQHDRTYKSHLLDWEDIHFSILCACSERHMPSDCYVDSLYSVYTCAIDILTNYRSTFLKCSHGRSNVLLLIIIRPLA